MTDFFYLKDWLDRGNRPVILECVPSRSGMSLSVYDREKLLYRINGCGFDRLGCALAEFLERLYQPELWEWLTTAPLNTVQGWGKDHVILVGEAGIESMRSIADAIGLHVQVHETRNATILIIQKAR